MTATARLWVTGIAVLIGALLLNAERDDPTPGIDTGAEVGAAADAAGDAAGAAADAAGGAAADAAGDAAADAAGDAAADAAGAAGDAAADAAGEATGDGVGGMELPDGSDEDGDGLDAGGSAVDGSGSPGSEPADGGAGDLASCEMTVDATLLHVREGPSFHDAVVDELDDGETVRAVGVVENGWRRLADGRWAHNDYLAGTCG